MTKCGTYSIPDLELSKEEEIDNLLRTLRDIKPLLEKYEKLTGENLDHRQDAFNQREYYKERYEYFYQELLLKLDGDEEKLKDSVKNWESSGGVL
jgi:hypothetical protein